MATFIGIERQGIATLKHLIELEFDAVAAYTLAVRGLHDALTRDRMAEFMSDHQRHIQELGRLVREMGELPPEHADIKALLTQGKVLAGGVSGDGGILRGMRSNEDDTNRAYEQALRRADFQPQVRHILEAALEDERRHRAWIEAQLAML